MITVQVRVQVQVGVWIWVLWEIYCWQKTKSRVVACICVLHRFTLH